MADSKHRHQQQQQQQHGDVFALLVQQHEVSAMVAAGVTDALCL